MKNRHLTIYVGDQEPRDKPAFLWIHRDPVTGYILFQINNGIDSWETITDSSMIAENMQHTLDILNDYIEDAQEAIEAAEQLAQDMSTHAVPYIGDNGNWFTWNYQTNQYEDTGKQAKGDTGAQGTQGPQGEAGPAGPQGPQGNTGSSVDYPYELVNNCTTDDATKGLAASQGVVLKGEVSQLSQEINGEETTETITRYARNQGKALRTTGAVETISSGTSIVDTFTNIKGSTRYLVTGRVGASANSCLVCFYDENYTFITGSASYPTSGTATPVLDYEVTSPANAVNMRVAGNSQSDYAPVVKEVVAGVSLPDRVENLEEEVSDIKSVNPGFDLRGMPHEVINGYYIAGSTQKWVSAKGGVEHTFKVKKGEIIKIVANSTVATNYAYLTDYSSISDGATPSFLSGYATTYALPAGQIITIEVPADCFLAINCATGTSSVEQRYPQHIYINGDNPFYGLKSVWQGPSTMYGLGTSPLSTRFSERVAKYLCMSHTNYAESGSTIAKKPDSYESAYGSLADFTAAVSGGLVDTTKKYLVKDSVSTTFPWTIYYYDGNDWVSVQRTAANVQRSPMVDRLSELDADADVIVFLGGSNDFMYDWAEIGEDTDRINTTIKGAMHLICQHLVTNFPDKFIIWINAVAAFRYQGSYTTPFSENNLGYTGWEEGEAVREVLRQYSIPYIDMAGEGGLTPENSSWWDDYDSAGTRVHPNAKGYLRLTKYLASKMLDLKTLVV